MGCDLGNICARVDEFYDNFIDTQFYNTLYHYVIVIICVMNDKLIEGKITRPNRFLLSLQDLIFLSNTFFNFTKIFCFDNFTS
jgi:hypothetical protein